jgi:hypothetical protein
MTRQLAALGALLMVASCTEVNPGSCLNNRSVCREGTVCVVGKDTQGREWSICAPVDASAELGVDGLSPRPADGSVQRDAGVDQGVADVGLDAPVDVAADAPLDMAADAPADADIDALGWDTRPPQPDQAAPDSAPGCTNACNLGSQQCGPGGGVQACVMGSVCTSWSAENACQVPKTCQQSGAVASCACPTPCTLNSRKCGTNGGLQECVSQGGCTTWGAETACQSPPNGSAMCSGSTCSVTCRSGYLNCSDGTCGAKARTFESGTLEGVYKDPSFTGIFTAPLAVRPFAAGSAVAADVKFQGANTVMWLRVPICPGVSGASLRGKNFRAKVFLEGPATPPPDFGFGAAALLPDGWGGIAELSSISVHFTETLMGTFPDVEYSDRVNELIISVGAKGNTGPSGWTGTVFVDDIQID